MATSALVDNQIDDGERYLARLRASGFDVAAAAWVLVSEEERWFYYVVTKAVDEKGPAGAYRDAYGVLGTMDDPWISMFEIKLIEPDNPIARDILDIQRVHAEVTPTRTRRNILGNLAIQEAYIYPRSKPKAQILAKGKEEVLRYLEEQSKAISGSPGDYMLLRDKRGNLIAFIAGHSFIGGGTIELGSNRLIVVNGLLTEIAEK